MSENTAQERTEEATPKKLREAREKGQVPRSKELNSLMLLLASAGGLLVMGQSMVSDLKEVMQYGLSIEPARSMDTNSVVESFSTLAVQSLIIVAPLFLLLTVAVIMTPIGIGGFSFSMKAVSFKFEKLDPIKGLGKIFALKGLMELIKVLAKFALVAMISGLIILSLIDEILGLGEEPLQQALAHLARLCGWSFLACSCALILVAAIDVPFQLWQHSKELKMTKQEIKDESKETDGRPEVKSRIRTMQQELSQRRMMENVPDADVVITNPTHFSVALRYDQFDMQAPVVVAKGADFVALRIRSVADENHVAIIEAPPLARALYASTEIDQEVPAGLYVAVANILSYVYQIDAGRYGAGGPPEIPTDLPIPDELVDVLTNKDDIDKNEEDQ